ncbi:MAG: glycosyltransferase, partial [Xenococcaceae cyanobacterium]
MLEQITPLLLTYNEAPNIERTLQKLTWAKTIIVIDSYSTDNTLEILSTYPQIEILQREFDSHTNQWNYGLEQIKTEWLLSLDADYVLTDELIAEISNLSPESASDGYFAPFKYCVFGKPLRGSILPPR